MGWNRQGGRATSFTLTHTYTRTQECTQESDRIEHIDTYTHTQKTWIHSVSLILHWLKIKENASVMDGNDIILHTYTNIFTP